MPRDGKTPLTVDQTAAIRWWVAVGAPRKGTVQALNASAAVQASIEAALGLRAANAALADAKSEPLLEPNGSPEPDRSVNDAVGDAANIPPASIATLDALEGKGFVVRGDHGG